MTEHEKAVRYAKVADNPESNRAASRRYYYANKFKCLCSSWRYDQEHYQKRLEYFRARSKAKNDAKRKIAYKPRMSRRVPAEAENAAHARSLFVAVVPMKIGEAIQSLR